MEIQDDGQDGYQGHGKYRNGHTSLFNSHRSVLLCVLACMHVCPPNNKRGDVSMTFDVCKSKMAAKVATTNMKIIKMTITSFSNSPRNVLLVSTHVLSSREYERICLYDKRGSQIQDGCRYSHHKHEMCVKLTIPSLFYFVLSDILMVQIYNALTIRFEK